MTQAMASPVAVIHNPSADHLQQLGVADWPIWSCGVSTFPWTYDEPETCLLLEGEVTVTPDGGEPVRFGAGDLVTFAAGLSCSWDVHAAVRKHYRFG
ncbi:MAG: cupin domain-containing protein [Cyanobacteria bacterium M_surface_7_m2_037]|nr:cupin domain-containing protein [Cyanobacteria bacterium M_surface_7_m2_037]